MSAETAWYVWWRNHFSGGIVVCVHVLVWPLRVHECVYSPVYRWECICLAFEDAAFPCVSLLWGSWGPACSSVQHRDSDTSCIHRHRPLPAFDVRSAAQPLTTETLRIHQHLQFQKKKRKKKKKDRNNSLLFTCFYYLTGEEKLFDICGQKTSCSGLGTLGCLTDWLHGQSSQGLSLCPTAFQTAPGLREFCLGRKNDKLELHLTKSESRGLD